MRKEDISFNSSCFPKDLFIYLKGTVTQREGETDILSAGSLAIIAWVVPGWNQEAETPSGHSMQVVGTLVLEPSSATSQMNQQETGQEVEVGDEI